MAGLAGRSAARPRRAAISSLQVYLPPRQGFRTVGPSPSIWQWLPRAWRTRVRTGPRPPVASVLQLPRLERFDIDLSDAEFHALSAMEQVRYAMNRPVPSVAPDLADPRLLRVLAGPTSGRLLPERLEKEFHVAYHPERLEWLGDRIAYGVAGEVLFALAPLDEKADSKPELRGLHGEYVFLLAHTRAKS